MGRIIPYIMENKIHVWSHQPDMRSCTLAQLMGKDWVSLQWGAGQNTGSQSQRICGASSLPGWWYTCPFEKYESTGMMTFPIWWEKYGKIIQMFQTTNQLPSDVWKTCKFDPNWSFGVEDEVFNSTQHRSSPRKACHNLGSHVVGPGHSRLFGHCGMSV